MRRPVPIASVTAVLTAVLTLSACSSGSDGAAPSSPPVSAPTSAPSSVPTPSAVTTPPFSSATPSPVPSSTGRAPASTTRATSSAARRPSSAAVAAPSAPVTLRNGVVVLNAGHNGGNASHTRQINRLVPAGYGQRKPCDTTGTQSNAGYSEHAFNFDVAKRVQRALQAAGVRVVLVRSTDTGVGPCVDRRAAIGNGRTVLASVTIHADGAPSSGHGFHVNQASKRPDGATKKVADQSVALGRSIRRTLASSSGLTPSTYIGTNGMYFRSDFAALNLARRPATFLELGNMRNAKDAARQSSAAGRQRIASAITEGILDYLR